MRTVTIVWIVVLLAGFGFGCSDSKVEEETLRLRSELKLARGQVAEVEEKLKDELRSARARIAELEEKLNQEQRQNREIREELQRVEERVFTLRVNWEKAGEKAGTALSSWYQSAGEGLDALNEELKILKEKVFGPNPEAEERE